MTLPIGTGGIDNSFMLNSGYNPFEAAGLRRQEMPSNFAQMLEANRRSNQSGEGGASASADAPLPGKPVIDKDSKLFEMCQELETFLLKTLISSMRNTVQKSELLDTGFAGKMYEDMLYDEYAKSFAKNAGFGFAEMAYIELDRKGQQNNK